MTHKVDIYDTTLRDGTQAENFNLSVEDRVRISLKLDELGIDFIEGGWPGSNPSAVEFFKDHAESGAEACQAHRFRLHQEFQQAC